MASSTSRAWFKLAHAHQYMRLAEHQVLGPGMLLVRIAEHLLGALGIALFQIMFNDELELLHVEEVVRVLLAHCFVPLHTIVQVVVRSGWADGPSFMGFEPFGGDQAEARRTKIAIPRTDPIPWNVGYEQPEVNVEPALDKWQNGRCPDSFVHGSSTAHAGRPIESNHDLIRSISGIRGTIGGAPGEGLTPLDVVRYTAAFGMFIKQRSGCTSPRMVLGRDARISGPMVRDLVVGTLIGLGFEVIDLGLATTPTVEMAVPGEKADGGIILTASHNPAQWNALKLLNEAGEFIIRRRTVKKCYAAQKPMNSTSLPVDRPWGRTREVSAGPGSTSMPSWPWTSWMWKRSRKANFRVVVDAVNSVGGTAVPALLTALGVLEVVRDPLHAERRVPAQPGTAAGTPEGPLRRRGEAQSPRGHRCGPGCGPLGAWSARTAVCSAKSTLWWPALTMCWPAAPAIR